MTLRARFAPSPTGYLHVGGARTALFNWLLVRKGGGVFVLRIEDTDRERSTEAHTQAILTGMEWLGLDWDEGPFFQSQGLERHEAHALQLLESGAAYRDFSTPEAAAQDREEEKASGGRSRKARQRADAMTPGDVAAWLEAGEPFAVRFRVPEGETVWQDGVHGEMRFKNDEIDDLVILRSDGTPTYNLAVVSDDVEMGITLVLRGDDHLSNTPKQILLYEALGRPVPTFAHVPLILGPDGKRLSKRHGATAVGDYEKEGILPEAMFNFLAFLGWSPGDDREIFSRPELVEAFSLERVLKKSAVFDLEKLRWMNGQHLMRMPTEELLPKVEARLREEGVLGTPGTAHAPETPPAADVAKTPGTAEATDVAKTPGAAGAADVAPASGEVVPDTAGIFPLDLSVLIDLLKPRSRTVEELITQAVPYFLEQPPYDPDAVAKHWLKDPQETLSRLELLASRLAAARWEPEALEEAVRGLAEELGVGAGKVIHPLRVALTGVAASPGIFDLLMFLGPERSLRRLQQALALLRSGKPLDPGSQKTLS
jgi:glutamyl-tRNA synthetase